MPTGTDGGARRFANFAWGVLAYNLAVVLWGAYVRATGSGAGCGNHWPLCNGEITPLSPSAATLIEYTHRVMSGFDLALVAVLVIWAFRAFPKGHPVRPGAALSGIFLVSEALLGAALVLLQHVARNESASRAWSLSAHLLNTLTLIACLALTAWWASGRPRIRLGIRGTTMATLTLAAFMLLGVSGAIAALGDTLFPVQSLSQGFAQDFSPTANIFLRLRLWHPVLAALVGLWIAFYALRAVTRRPDARLAAGLVMSLVGAELMVGMTNLFLLAPLWTQMVHLLVGDALWISLVLLCATLLTVPAKAERIVRR